MKQHNIMQTMLFNNNIKDILISFEMFYFQFLMKSFVSSFYLHQLLPASSFFESWGSIYLTVTLLWLTWE